MLNRPATLGVAFTTLAVLGAGCAVPEPLSERTLFQADYPEWDELRTVGFVATRSLAGDRLRQYTDRRFEPEGQDDDVDAWNAAASGIALGFPVLRRAHAELDIHVGIPVLGFDGTVRLRDRMGVSATVGWRRGQVIAQHVLVDRRGVGIGLGAFGRVDRIRVDTSQPSYFGVSWAEEAAHVASFGGRFMMRGVWTGDVIRGIASVGYAPALDAPIVRFGFAVYGFQ
jgi:hypothetical protein